VAIGAFSSDAFDVQAFDESAFLFEESGVIVPDVVGQSQEEGTSALEGEGFVVAVETAHSSTVPAGQIISQSPAAGLEISSGSTVTITVSLGEAKAEESFAGGFIYAFEREMARRRKEARERAKAEEEAQALQDALDREIAELLHKQEAEQAKAQELERLKALVSRYDNSGTSSERVEKAYARALAQQNMSAFLALNRELERMLEEEELLVLTMLLQ
jgi:hypothetical protein